MHWKLYLYSLNVQRRVLTTFPPIKMETIQALWVQIKELLLSCFASAMNVMSFEQITPFFICFHYYIKWR